jgi:hypothetical protein
MGIRYVSLLICVFWGVGLTACGSPNPVQKTSKPKYDDMVKPVMTSVRFDENSVKTALNEKAKQESSCSFSSIQRKHTLGYEIDPSRHVAFTASPSFDIWDPSDFKARFSLRFTKSLGGEALKRPCTFGSGYYGLIPYISNNPDTFATITNPTTVKSMVQDRLDEREQERQNKDREDFDL